MARTRECRALSAAAQQSEIAAINERAGIMDQPVREAAGGRVFPFDGREEGLLGAGNLDGDIAWAAAGLMDVIGQQELDQPRLLYRRKLQGARKQSYSAALEPTNKAHGEVEAQLGGVVGW